MPRYVAFLRGVNVGGRGAIAMSELRERFTALGFDSVSTYRATGNILFASDSRAPESVRRRLQEALRRTLGDELEVLLRPSAELQSLVPLDPFRRSARADAVPYVTFVNTPIRDARVLPLRSPRSDVELFEIRGRDVFSWGLPTKDGHYGFPNLFVETTFGQAATTRNWRTVTGVAATAAEVTDLRESRSGPGAPPGDRGTGRSRATGR